MRLPRRTPSRHGAAELQAMYSHLYPRGGMHAIALDEDYRAQRSAGLAHCRVWLHRGACPYAVESTMALIEAQQLDEQTLFLRGGGGGDSTSTYAVRTAYAMAIVRFVNALADAMQTGLYAQSIFRIAERIGLPAWFVELRHAATHEELPTLDVLRHASVEALAWLQTHFWLPNVQRDVGGSTSSGAAIESGAHDEQDLSDSATAATRALLDEAADTLRGHVAAYRRLAKSVVRDASLRGPNRAAISVVQSRIVTCVRQADVAVSQYNSVGGSGQSNGYEAADVLAAVLLEPGGLIPLSRHKRVRATEQEPVVALPSVLADTWLPLLQYLTDAMDAFTQALLDELLDRLTAAEHGTLVDMAASWLTFLLTDEARSLFDRGVGKAGGGADDDRSTERERQSVMVVRRCLVQPTKSSIAVAQHLCAQSASLTDRLGHLLALAVPLSNDGLQRTSADATPAETHVEAGVAGDDTMTDLERSLEAMERQLEALRDKGGPLSSSETQPTNDTLRRQIDAQRQQTCVLLAGWTLASEHDWRPTPIGCLNGRVPTLELS